MLVSLQACRGGALDDGVEVDSATDTSTASVFQQYLSVPMDTVVMYATAPGEPNSPSDGPVPYWDEHGRLCHVSSLKVENYRQRRAREYYRKPVFIMSCSCNPPSKAARQ